MIETAKKQHENEKMFEDIIKDLGGSDMINNYRKLIKTLDFEKIDDYYQITETLSNNNKLRRYLRKTIPKTE